MPGSEDFAMNQAVPITKRLAALMLSSFLPIISSSQLAIAMEPVAIGSPSNAPASRLEAAFSSLLQAEILESAYVGDAGSLSENLQNLRVLLKSENSRELLRRLHEHGTLIAKLYAIIGFQILEERDLSLDLIKKTDPYSSEFVAVMEGCIFYERNVGELLEVIAKGYYKNMFASALDRS
jgi:hypothetical protein